MALVHYFDHLRRPPRPICGRARGRCTRDPSRTTCRRCLLILIGLGAVSAVQAAGQVAQAQGAEKVEIVGLWREAGYTYFLRGQAICRTSRRLPGVVAPSEPEEIARCSFVREPGYLYSIDGDGDVVRGRRRRSKAPSADQILDIAMALPPLSPQEDAMVADILGVDLDDERAA